MAVAVLAVGALRIALPPELRLRDAPWAVFAVLAVLMVAIMIGDPGRIDRPSRWLRVLTETLIAVIDPTSSASQAVCRFCSRVAVLVVVVAGSLVRSTELKRRGVGPPSRETIVLTVALRFPRSVRFG
jgi:hypothetical protein